jgi:hypothetical protein
VNYRGQFLAILHPASSASSTEENSKVSLMLFILFFFLILLSSEPAYAEWKEFIKSEQGHATYYIDTESIRRKGNLVKIWVL